MSRYDGKKPEPTPKPKSMVKVKAALKSKGHASS